MMFNHSKAKHLIGAGILLLSEFRFQSQSCLSLFVFCYAFFKHGLLVYLQDCVPIVIILKNEEIILKELTVKHSKRALQKSNNKKQNCTILMNQQKLL